MYRNILVAIDGSKCAERAFEKALETVDAGGMLTIIHVLQLPPIMGRGKKLAGEVEAFLRKDAKLFLAEHAERVTVRGVKAYTVLAKGTPGEVIVDTAKSISADVIVIGSRGLGGIKGLMLGSVSNAVVHSATIPVLVVK